MMPPQFPVRSRPVRWGIVGVTLGVLLLIAACGAPRNVVEVTERATLPTDTVAEATDDTLSNTVSIPSGYDTVSVGRFDRGKLWPFEQLPVDHFRSAYGVEADTGWQAKARGAALRFGESCSASFVSGQGLVMTNHHCAREAISRASHTGESLLEQGFYADSLNQERSVSDLHVDALVRIEEVTSRVTKKNKRRPQGGSRGQRVERIEDAMTEKAKKQDDRLRVEIVKFYGGAKYSAYTYRRYDNVRLVMAPERSVGFFGGASDNFTYPRFSFDIAFFRVYTEEGIPLRPEHHFEWDVGGAEPGDPVFVVGNPASTDRLATVSQLKYKRDHELPAKLEMFRKRRDFLESYVANNPGAVAQYDLRNVLFSVRNEIKSIEGKLNGLTDPYLLARRGAALRALQDTISAVDSLQQYMGTIGKVKRLQESKRILSDKHSAFLTFSNKDLGSRLFVRAVHAYYYDFLRMRGASPERVRAIRNDAEDVKDWPAKLEHAFIVAQLKEIRAAYGASHPTMQRLFQKRSPSEWASHLIEKSALMDAGAFEKLLDEGYRKSEDVSVSVIESLAPLYLNVSRQMEDIQQREEKLNGHLSRVRRAIYGDQIPPDATFSPRISGGIVKGYDQNGSAVPPYTTFQGMYDRHQARDAEAWSLPERWQRSPEAFDVNTPLNIVSTNDVSGGNSGSPLLNKDLEIVGVVFDSNMEALPNEYLYRNQSARAISVDVRGIVEALRDLYGATRLLNEMGVSDETAEWNESSSSLGGPR